MKIVKGGLGIGLLAIVLYAGFAKFPLWSLLILAFLFTIAYIQTKWHLWHDLFQSPGLKLYQLLFSTYVIQLIVVFILYLLGSGIARLVGR